MNSQDENLTTPQKSKSVLNGISPIRSSAKAVQPVSGQQMSKSTIFGVPVSGQVTSQNQMLNQLQMPILNKFRRNEGVQRGTSIPKADQNKPLTESMMKSKVRESQDLSKFELSDKTSRVKLNPDDENLLESPNISFLDNNQDSRQSLLAYSPGNMTDRTTI